MPVTINSLRLWGATDDTDAVDANLDVTSAPSQTPSEALLVALEAVESMTLSGLVTGIRLTTETGYPSDPVNACSEWVQEFVSLVSPEQGSGWSITDDERSRTITVTASSGTWTHAAGDPASARWTLDVTRGDGVMPSTARSPTTQTTNSTATLGGTDLGTVREKQTELRLDLNETPIALQGTDATVLHPEGGVVRRVDISGRKGGAPADLETFDDTLRGNVGGNQTFSYQTGVPGTNHTVMIGAYDSTFTAGSPALLEYNLTLFEGVNL